MDIILRNATIAGQEGAGSTDIGIDQGRIAAIQPGLPVAEREIDLEQSESRLRYSADKNK